VEEEIKYIKRKMVIFPIQVPEGDYCWDYSLTGSCDHFDNEGGHETCDLNFYQKCDKNGVLKDPDCKSLKEF